MTDKQMQEPVAWGVFEGGNLHDMFFSKEEAEHMALLKGSHVEVRPLYTTPPAQPAPVQEPVAWDVFNGICHHSTHGTESSAKAMAAEMQKNHDLSGSIAAFKVKPRMLTPPAQPAVQEPVFKPCSCRWKGEEQVQQCTLHAAHIEAIHEWAERAKTAEAKLKEKTNDK